MSNIGVRLGQVNDSANVHNFELMLIRRGEI